MSPWLAQLLIALALTLINIIGVAVTAILLPGIWLMLLCAGLAQWWQRALYGTWMFSWWTLGLCTALALLAEIIEFAASAIGASRFGGSRWGGAGAILGAVLGAIAGSLVVPILGTIVGAAAGAFLGALLSERHIAKRSWQDANRAGTGAAIGRLSATLVKVIIACLVAIALSVDALVP
ncbi:MAG TPA: DUF456 domain-containing protein [Phycisphaerales bacterium]|nr:DUF456 domain-containing protein [Phycisphaerales bacterium]